MVKYGMQPVPYHTDASLVLHKFDTPEGKHAFWHSSAHLMAEALEALYPGIKFGIGPAIENGFYYDVDPGDGVVITEADLPRIEEKMVELSRKNSPYVREEIGKEDVLKLFRGKGDQYKVELIEDLQDGTITLYKQGNFTDLCRGPHVPDTGHIKAIKLLSVAGAYWRGDEKRKQLTRIYGITFPKKQMLDDYLVMLEQAKARDHRKLGKELELVYFFAESGAGIALMASQRCPAEGKAREFPEKDTAEIWLSAGDYAAYRPERIVCNLRPL